MRKPSCLISCSHWLPDGSLSVLVGRHGAMNPAGRVRCNMRNQIRLANHNCNFYRLKACVLLPCLGHDALRLRRGKPGPPAKTSPRRVGATVLRSCGCRAQRRLKEKPRLAKRTGPELDRVIPLKSPVSPTPMLAHCRPPVGSIPDSRDSKSQSRNRSRPRLA